MGIYFPCSNWTSFSLSSVCSDRVNTTLQSPSLNFPSDDLSAVLVRGSEKGKAYSVRLRDLIKRGDISANVDVKPGDVLIIPQSWF